MPYPCTQRGQGSHHIHACRRKMAKGKGSFSQMRQIRGLGLSIELMYVLRPKPEIAEQKAT